MTAPLVSKTGSFAQPSSTGAQAITGVGFTPKAIIFFGVGASATGWGVQIDASVGFVSSSSAYYTTGISSYDAHAGSLTHRFHDTKAFGIIWNNVLYSPCTLTSFDADGFTLNWSAVSAGQNVCYLALGGTELTNAKVIAWQSPASTGNKSVTGVGFQPDVVLHMGIMDSTAPQHKYTGGDMDFGAMDGAGHQWARAGYSKSGANPSVTGRIQVTDACLIDTSETTSITSKASYVSMDTDGFTLNFSTNTSSRYYFSICLKGGGYKVGNWSKSTAGAPVTDTISGLGFTPSSVFVTTDSYAASAAHQTGHRLMFGASDGTNNRLVAATDKTGVATTVAKQTFRNDGSITVTDNDAVGYDAFATIGTFASGQFAATWAVNNAVATQICYVAFGTNNVTVAGVTATASATAHAGMVLGATFTNNWTSKTVQAKGQLHCHSTNSDGTLTPTQVVTAYKDDGYDFVNISDHDYITPDPAVSGITYIAGNESNTASCHLGCVDVPSLPSGSTNEAIAQVAAQGGWSQINHPDYTDYAIHIVSMQSLVGYDAIEYVNGFEATGNPCYPNNTLMPIPQVHVDWLLSMGKRFWLTAGDDCHDHASTACQQRDNCWVKVNSENTTKANIMANMKAGNFYISDGALISSVSTSGNAITITVPVSSTITFQTPGPTIAQTNTAVTSATYYAQQEDTYVLIKVVRTSDSKRAWAQPLFNDIPPTPYFSKVGSFNSPTATGSQSITGLGFKPKALILWANPQYTDSWSGNSTYAMGFTSTAAPPAIVSYSVSSVGQHGLSTSDERRMNTATALSMVQYDSTTLLNATLTSADIGGFTLNWSTVYTNPMRVHYLALGGAALTNASVVEWWPSGTGNQSVTSIAFQPDVVIHMGDYSGTQAPHGDVTAVNQLGAMDAAGNQWSQYMYAQDAVTTTNAARLQLTDSCIVGTGATTGVLSKATYVAMLSNGFTVNWSAQQGRVIGSLCLKGGGYQVGTWNKSTAGAPVTDTISGLSGGATTLKPYAVLAASDSYTTSASAHAGLRTMLGASDGNHNEVGGCTNENGVTSTLAYRYSYATKSLVITDAVYAEDAMGTMGSFAAGSFHADWTTNNAVATQIGYVAFGVGNVTVVGIQATTDTFTAHVPTLKIGVKITGVTATTDTATAHVPTIKVKAPGVHATNDTFTAHVPTLKIGVKLQGVTAYGTFTATVPTLKIGVKIAGVTATTDTATASVPTVKIGVTVLGIHATTDTFTAHVPTLKIGVIISGVTASATGTATVPTLKIGVIILGVHAENATGTATAPLIGVGVVGVTASATATAHVPTFIIDTFVEGITATTDTFTATVADVSNATRVVGVTSYATFNAYVPTLIIGVVFEGVTSRGTFTAHVPTIITRVYIEGVTANTDTFTGTVPTISVGVIGQTASGIFTTSGWYPKGWIDRVGAESVFIIAFEANTLYSSDGTLYTEELTFFTEIDEYADSEAEVGVDEPTAIHIAEGIASEMIYAEGATLTTDEESLPDVLPVFGPQTLRPAPVAEVITIITEEEADAE